MLNIFINTWGNYNENGADGGEWVTLPMTEEELENTLQQIADNMGDLDPEFCIHDFEWTSEIEPRDISEYENIMALNEEINELDALEDWEQKEIAAAMEAFGYTFTEAMNRQQRGCFTLYAVKFIDIDRNPPGNIVVSPGGHIHLAFTFQIWCHIVYRQRRLVWVKTLTGDFITE